jgi:YD repeat-containing protein
VISDTSRSYTYDALNRLIGLTAGAEQQVYAYNGDGVLISQTVNGAPIQFTQDLAAPQSQILQAQAADGTTTDDLYGQDRLAAANSSARRRRRADGPPSMPFKTLEPVTASWRALLTLPRRAWRGWRGCHCATAGSRFSILC